ncbi:Membrane protein involved in the export of O-antigen and teichoic acid [Sphingomonas laterariae]|uniref:Membrane protein involved in the export of O-antigen and teichoic acid n=1 Tax=Edaphosphingomonas laterariae TaxID=861865 RepID=A0A239ECB5_9SPHN|nr:oligosaccharide flippase family protein [Sphingomonas laterariae]SNS42410.1 Membrane protein involved in the export of O-antigen and teichoic acid [Sphingomonas laterariae]
MNEAAIAPAASRWRMIAAKAKAPATLVAGTVVILNIIRIVSSMVLTRMLDVEVFGVVGILTSITIIFGMISDLGFAAYVIRSAEGTDKRFLDEIWTLRLMRSAGLAVLLAVLAWPISAYIGEPDLAPALAVFGMSFLLEGITSMATATSIRNGQVGRISLFDISAAVIQTALTIFIAYFLRSYWAIIYATLLGNVVKIVLSYAMFSGSRRHWHFSRARAAELWRFARYITGSSILTMIISQSDKIALSRFLPLDLFGLYMIAVTLAQGPLAFAAPYANRVLFPAYARIAREEPAALRERFYSWRRRISALFALAAGGLVTSAPLAIELLYDPRYRGASVYLQLLAIGAIPALNTQAANAVLIAAGRMWTTMASNIVRLCWLIGGGTLGYLGFGPIGLIAAVGTVEVAAQLYYWFALGRNGLLNVKEELLLLAAALLGALLGEGVTAVGLLFIH